MTSKVIHYAIHRITARHWQVVRVADHEIMSTHPTRGKAIFAAAKLPLIGDEIGYQG